MKTTKLSKNFAALCLSVAAFCAAQDGFAQALAPEWKNSYTDASQITGDFYVYHTGQKKFMKNSNELKPARETTSWTYSDNKLITWGEYLNRSSWGLVQFNASKSTDFTLEFDENSAKWGVYCVASNRKYYMTHSLLTGATFGSAVAYDWWFISAAQFNNHLALETYNTQNNSAKTYENKVPTAYWLQIVGKVNVPEYLANNNFSGFALDTDQSVDINEKANALQSWLVNAPSISTAYDAAKKQVDAANGILAAAADSPAKTALQNAVNEADIENALTVDVLDAGKATVEAAIATYNAYAEAYATAQTTLSEAQGFYDNAAAGEAKTILGNAIDAFKNALAAAATKEEVESAVEALESAIEDFENSDAGRIQYVEALAGAISEAEAFTPHFAFIDDAIEIAEAAKADDNLDVDGLDAAKTALEGVVAQAQAILESDEYKVYLSYLSNIDANLAKAAEYTEYSCDQLSTTKSEAETALLGISDANDLTTINDNLKAALKTPNADLARYGAAEDLVKHAAAVGYNEADGLAAVKSSTLEDLRQVMIDIRTAALDNIPEDFFETHPENVDMTIFIENNSFEYGDTTGWNVENMASGGIDNDTAVKSNNDPDPKYETESTDGGYYYNTWYHTGMLKDEAGCSISQNLTDLPNGLYRLEALLTSDPNNTTSLSVNSTRVGGVKSSVGQGKFANAFYEFYVEDGKVSIGAMGQSKGLYSLWFRADNFRLTLLSAKVATFKDNVETYAYKEGEMVRAKVYRTIQPGKWTTLCLPMECAIPPYVTLYEVNKDKETKVDEHVSIVVEASSDTKIQAGKPYIVNYPKSHRNIITVNHDPITEFVASGVELAEEPQTVGAYVPFVGLFEPTDLNAGDIYVSTSTDASVAAVYKELSADASNTKMNGFRAYFKVTDGASSNVRFITDEVITNIMQAIEDQQVANGTYDLSGRKAATLQKGTYVIDGKKVIIK